MSATLLEEPTTEPIVVDQKDFLAAVQLIQQRYGDNCIIGEPYLDKYDRIFGEVTRNGKYLEDIYLGPSIPHKIDSLLWHEPLKYMGVTGPISEKADVAVAALQTEPPKKDTTTGRFVPMKK